MAESAMRRFSMPEAQWHYEEGLLMKAVSDTAAAAGKSAYDRFAREWVDRWVTPEGNIHTYRIDEFNLDQIYPGRLLFSVHRDTGQERYLKAIQLLREQLRRQPRTQDGGFWHKRIYPHQMWLDGMYMAGPFYAEYALRFAEPEDFDDIARQIMLIEQKTRDPKTGLMYHGWDASRAQSWADPQTGCSPHFWGRGMGWFAMAVVDVLDYFPGDHPQRGALAAILERAAGAILRVQDNATGLWHQVLDRAGDAGNYLESSASAMFAYAFAKGVRRHWLPADFLAPAVRAFRGLLEHQIRRNADGTVSLEGTCAVAGLGGRPYRDGSYDYYVGEKPLTNDPKGVGSFILAALEMEAAGIAGLVSE
jgi:unsaturated rhamnogalacturonyl hydrolase